MISTLGETRSPESVLQITTDSLIDYLKKDILPTLAQYGIYNLAPNDFLTDNFAYDGLKRLTGDIENYEQELRRTIEQAADYEKRNAQENIITGPGFSILSNSIADHAIYAMQSKSVLSKQQRQYSQVASKIDSNKWKAISDGEKEKRKDSVQERDLLIQFCFEVVAVKYYEYLVDLGQIDARCLSGIDEGRSNELLQNLDFVPNKEGVIFQAIQCCPYNLNIYLQICQSGMPLHPVYKEILESSGAIEDFKTLLLQICDHTAPKISEIYRKNKQIISFLSFLLNSSPVQVANNLLRGDVESRFALYQKLAGVIRDNRIAEFFRNRYRDVPISERWSHLAQELSEIQANFNASEISFMIEFCNIDVFKLLSAWFGQTIDSFQTVDHLIKKAWNDVENRSAIQECERRIRDYKAKLQPKPVAKDDDSLKWWQWLLLILLWLALTFLTIFTIYTILKWGFEFSLTFIVPLLLSGLWIWLHCYLAKIAIDKRRERAILKEKIAKEENLLKELKGE